MTPLLTIENQSRNSEDLIEDVTNSIEKLTLHLSAMSRFSFDNDLPSDEFNAIICGLHLQVYEIQKQLKNFKP